MNALGIRILLLSLGLLVAVSWAVFTADKGGMMTGHWDSVVLVACGALVVWREVYVAMQGRANRRRKAAWGALASWRQPAREGAGWMPAFAKLASRRSRR